MWHNKSTEL